MTRFQETSVRASVHSIDHFALNVPDLAEAEKFFRAFGLDVVPVGDERRAVDLYAADNHRWARILSATRKSLAYLSFGCFADDFDRLREQIIDAGAELVTGETKEGLWFSDLDGNLVQVAIGPKTSPSSKARAISGGCAADERGSHTRSQTERIHPRRLSHVFLFTPDVLRALDFYNRALGLRLSDKSRDLIAFTHAPHGSDHHLVAFAKSTARGWHHSAWDVNDVNMVGAGAAQMEEAGYSKGWGTGRHVLGSNYFHYIGDPWGSFCEYSADIDYISAGFEWPAGDFPAEDSLYLWGPPVPEYFTQNTEAHETSKT